jgi:integrase/recombinase XerD
VTTRMQDAAREYLELRRALGSQLRQPGQLLMDFAARLDDGNADHLPVAAAVAWATEPEGVTPYWHWYRLLAIRGFSRYLHALDCRNEIVPENALPHRYTRAVPYIFTAAEITALMCTAASLPRRLPAATYQALIGLLAVTGMRPGEAYALDREHVDLSAGTVMIAHSKNGTSRQLPLHPTAAQALACYASRRDELFPDPGQPSFLLSVRGTRLHPNVADGVFRGLARSAGLHAPSPRTRPVLKSLRHTFAVMTMIGWYKDGMDADAQMPLLSSWMGHSGPASTYYYISAVPELLALAAAKMTLASQAFEDEQRP